MTGDRAQSELSVNDNHDIGTCPRCHLEPSIGGSLFLEVDTNGGEEGAGVGGVEVVVGDVGEAGLEVHGRVIAQLHAYNSAYVETCLGGAAIEVLIVRMDRGEAYTQAKAVIHLIGVTRHAGRLVTKTPPESES